MDPGHSDPKKQKPSDSIPPPRGGTPRKVAGIPRKVAGTREKGAGTGFLKYSGLGMQLLFTIGLSAWGGYALDKYLELKFPVFLLTFVFASFGVSMYLLSRSLNKNSDN